MYASAAWNGIPAIGHACALPHVSLGKHDLEHLRRDLCIVVEGLVEIAQTKQQERVGMTLFYVEILSPQRRHRRELRAAKTELVGDALVQNKDLPEPSCGEYNGSETLVRPADPAHVASALPLSWRSPGSGILKKALL